MNTILDDITGYRFRVFKLENVIDGVGINATMHDKAKAPMTYNSLNLLCKRLTGKGFNDYQYICYETNEYLEWAKTWRGRLSIAFWGGE